MHNVFYTSASLINNQIILIMARVFALFSASQLFNKMNIHLTTKILLVYLLSMLLLPFVIDNAVSNNIHMRYFLLCFLDQILIGCILGFTIQFLISCVTFMGEIISSQIGLSFSVFAYSGNKLDSSVISYLLSTFFVISFFACRGHLYFMVFLIKSFFISPLNKIIIYNNIFSSLLDFSNIIFFNGIYGALPILLFFLILYISLMILNRLYPDLSLSSSYSVIVFFLSMIVLQHIFYKLFFFSEIMIRNLFDFLQHYVFK
ncbi:flagellar biosynthetic protein FliR [Buchnera aphidicola]|uniref:flagellar biosynthetic protein FliR n=1 Tax=Buchnera aphidicola TaxID=9 RepID=UPI0009E1BAE3|nr:flagellar biosynthetic protein FliR [Buchnera aphidicola]